MAPLMGHDHNGSKIAETQPVGRECRGRVIDGLITRAVEGETLRSRITTGRRCRAIKRHDRWSAIRHPGGGEDATPERIELSENCGELRRVVLGVAPVTLR